MQQQLVQQCTQGHCLVVGLCYCLSFFIPSALRYDIRTVSACALIFIGFLAVQ